MMYRLVASLQVHVGLYQHSLDCEFIDAYWYTKPRFAREVNIMMQEHVHVGISVNCKIQVLQTEIKEMTINFNSRIPCSKNTLTCKLYWCKPCANGPLIQNQQERLKMCVYSKINYACNKVYRR